MQGPDTKPPSTEGLEKRYTQWLFSSSLFRERNVSQSFSSKEYDGAKSSPIEAPQGCRWALLPKKEREKDGKKVSCFFRIIIPFFSLSVLFLPLLYYCHLLLKTNGMAMGFHLCRAEPKMLACSKDITSYFISSYNLNTIFQICSSFNKVITFWCTVLPFLSFSFSAILTYLGTSTRKLIPVFLLFCISLYKFFYTYMFCTSAKNSPNSDCSCHKVFLFLKLYIQECLSLLKQGQKVRGFFAWNMYEPLGQCKTRGPG